MTPYTNEDASADLLAPGGFIPTDGGIVSSVPVDAFTGFHGTSMAAPHVAGAWSVLHQANPSSSVSETLTFLKDTGIPLPSPFTPYIIPRIQLDAALDAAIAALPQVAVGGTFVPVDVTSLLAAGVFSSSWMIPVLVSAVGLGFAVFRLKRK